MLRDIKQKLRWIVGSMMSVCLLSQSVYGSDVNQHWANNQIQKWIGYNIVRGYKNGDFKPNNFVSHAEFYSMINRILSNQKVSHKTLKDTNSKQWFYNEIEKGIASEFVLELQDGVIRPNEPVTRQEAAEILTNAFGLEESDNKVLEEFKDSQQISVYAKDAVGTMAAYHIINGYADKTFRPDNKLTRAEAVVIFDRLCGELYNSSDEEKQRERKGSMVVNALDTALKNIKIGGSLFVTEGVTHDTSLENLVIEKNLYLRNSAENTIRLVNIKADKAFVKTPSAYLTLNKKGTISIEANSVINELHLYRAVLLNISEQAALSKVVVYPQAAGTEINTKTALQVIVKADNVVINGKKAEKDSIVTIKENQNTVSGGTTTGSGSSGGNNGTVSTFELIDVTDGK